MNRRTFIQNTALVGLATLVPHSSLAFINLPKYKMGYQLYSIRDQMDQDPIKTLTLLKAMGYEDFETYGFDSEKGMFYGYKSKEFKQILNDLDLTVSSGHYGFHPYLDTSEEELERFVDQCIKAAKIIDSSYITWPWIAPEQRTLDNYKLMSKKLNKIGEQVTKSGLGFAYHNHGFEFEEHKGGTGFEIILSETDPDLVKLQMDLYWVMHSSKYTPKELIQEQPGRYVMWHIKDMHKISRDYTELGNGSIDYTKILPDPKLSGLECYYIEQGGNFTENSIKSAATSADYFKKHLQQFL